jgi:peroxiredoxin
MLKPGSKAPDIDLQDQNGKPFSLAKQGKGKVLVYFYPKADTPGCTQQSCGLRDVKDQIGRTKIVGISPDKPEKQKKFDDKYGLGFPLLADTENRSPRRSRCGRRSPCTGASTWASNGRRSSSRTEWFSRRGTRCHPRTRRQTF